jgi:hypothetical protein
MHTIKPSPVSYLAAESGGDQSGHNDHGDDDLDGGRNGSHVECMFPVDQCKRDEVSNYEIRVVKGRGKPTPQTRGQTPTASENFMSPICLIWFQNLKSFLYSNVDSRNLVNMATKFEFFLVPRLARLGNTNFHWPLVPTCLKGWLPPPFPSFTLSSHNSRLHLSCIDQQETYIQHDYRFYHRQDRRLHGRRGRLGRHPIQQQGTIQ